VFFHLEVAELLKVCSSLRSLGVRIPKGDSSGLNSMQCVVTSVWSFRRLVQDDVGVPIFAG